MIHAPALRRLALLSLLALVAACADFREGDGHTSVRICGNGTVDPGEECDDGNDVTERCAHGLPACTVCGASCTLVPGEVTRCGDGWHDPEYEECDDGNTVTEVCPWGRSCTICDERCRTIEVHRRCGDGTVDEDGGERCDDGEANSNERPDACRTDCLPARCGDGVRDTGEACEPTLDEGCRVDCTWIRCGDGHVDPPEECDPASGADDGCRADCILPRCGDGRIDPGEDCDGGVEAIVDVAWRGDAGCILTAGGAVRCAGGSEAFRAVPPSLAANAASIAVGDGFACALALDGGDRGTIECWGEDPTGDPARPVLTPPKGFFTEISVGAAHGCARDAASTRVECWGRIHTRELGTGFRAIASGAAVSCGRQAFRVSCWGTEDFGLVGGPSSHFSAATLAIGEHHACANRADNPRVVTCWGDDAGGKATPPPDLPRVRALALGADRSCALDEAGEPICWGAEDGLPPPAGPFERLVASGGGVCGLRDGALFCWGREAPPLPHNVDGIGGACRADCSAPTCGDGVLDPGEDCDDGDTVDDGDGCGADCLRTGRCGDGIVQPAVEACDDGNAVTEACPWGTSCVVCDASCRLGPGLEPRCGDGLLQAPHEECDEGDIGPRFSAIALEGEAGCGLLADGAIRCWGGAVAPAGEGHVDLAMGEGFVCGLAASGAIRCEGGAPPPIGAWEAIEAAGASACALDAAGAIACWGGIEAAPGGSGWRGLSVGQGGACALDPAGAISCWGDGMSAPPAGEGYQALAVGADVHCAIDGARRLRCWGPAAPAGAPAFPATAVAAGAGTACALDATGTIACFGPGANPPRVGRFTDLVVSGDRGCALGLDRLVRCWPSGMPEPTRNHDRFGATCHTDCRVPFCGDFLLDPGEDCDFGDLFGPWEICEYEGICDTCLPSCREVLAARPQCGDGVVDEGHELCDDGGAAAQVSLGAGFGCVLHAGERLRCWGADDEGQGGTPIGAYAHVATGERHACALDRGGQAHCWGAAGLGQVDAPRDLFRSLHPGSDFTCGLTEDDAIVCWGDLPFAQPIAGSWRSIAAGARHLCALGYDGAIACWGANDRGQSTPPPGSFEAIAVGAAHGCALDGAGAATCWGAGDAGQNASQAGPFDALAAGLDASCGRTPSGWSCWGAPIPLPPGDLEELALSRWEGATACGTTAAEVLVCAGAPGTLGATPPPVNSDEAPDACRSDCTPARCGDGVVDPGEACDDGGTAPGDGCDASCQIEAP